MGLFDSNRVVRIRIAVSGVQRRVGADHGAIPVVVHGCETGQNQDLEGGGMVRCAISSLIASLLILAVSAPEPPPLPGIDLSALTADAQALSSDPGAGIPPEFDATSVSLENPDLFTDLPQETTSAPNPFTVMTADEQWKLIISGALIGETIVSTQRISSQGSYLFVNSYLGRDLPGVEVQGRSTSLGATLIGPEIAGLQSGGQMLI